MSKAVDQMVIDHPDRLHVRIDDRRTHEGEATALQIVAHGVGLGAARGDIAFGSPAVLDRATVRSEEHTSELQSRLHLVCRLLLEKKKNNYLSRDRPNAFSRSARTT